MSYKEQMDAFKKGSLVNTEMKNLVSRTVRNTFIGFGVPVVQTFSNGAEHGVRLPWNETTPLFGVTVRERSSTEDGWSYRREARVMTFGLVAVEVGEDVEVGKTPVWDVVGKKWMAHNGVELKHARWETNTPSGGIAIIRMGMDGELDP